MSNTPIIAAVISAGVAAIAALVTNLVTIIRGRTERTYGRHKETMKEVQDAVQFHRAALVRYGFELSRSLTSAGGAVGFSVPPEVDAAVHAGRARIAMAVSRVEDPRIAVVVERWRPLSERWAIDSTDVSSTDEWDAFQQVVALTGQALRSNTGTLPR